MGRLVAGEWVTDDVATTDTDGRWHRARTVCRGWIRADGSTPYAAQAGRYHLWLAWNCTWSQRTMLVRNLLDAPHGRGGRESAGVVGFG